MNILKYLFILWLVCYLLFEYINYIQKRLKEIIKDYEKVKQIRKELKDVFKNLSEEIKKEEENVKDLDN